MSRSRVLTALSGAHKHQIIALMSSWYSVSSNTKVVYTYIKVDVNWEVVHTKVVYTYIKVAVDWEVVVLKGVVLKASKKEASL